VAPHELGPAEADQDPYERNNLWMFKSAKRFGARHLMEEVRREGGRAHWLDTTKLWD